MEYEAIEINGRCAEYSHCSGSHIRSTHASKFDSHKKLYTYLVTLFDLTAHDRRLVETIRFPHFDSTSVNAIK